MQLSGRCFDFCEPEDGRFASVFLRFWDWMVTGKAGAVTVV